MTKERRVRLLYSKQLIFHLVHCNGPEVRELHESASGKNRETTETVFMYMYMYMYTERSDPLPVAQRVSRWMLLTWLRL